MEEPNHAHSRRRKPSYGHIQTTNITIKPSKTS